MACDARRSTLAGLMSRVALVLDEKQRRRPRRAGGPGNRVEPDSRVGPRLQASKASSLVLADWGPSMFVSSSLLLPGQWPLPWLARARGHQPSLLLRRAWPPGAAACWHRLPPRWRFPRDGYLRDRRPRIPGPGAGTTFEGLANGAVYALAAYAAAPSARVGPCGSAGLGFALRAWAGPWPLAGARIGASARKGKRFVM
jgi:hypothetical protein